MYSKYKAAGFVEALLSIAVAGIASIALMGIAADTQTQVLKNEVSDSMTQEAIKNAEMVRKIADLHNNSDDVLFPDIGDNRNSCFTVEGSLSDPVFHSNGEVIVATCNYDAGGREACKGNDKDAELFSVYCITSDSDVDAGLAVGKVVTGLTRCNDDDNKGVCILSDYEYYIVLRIDK